MSYWVCVVNKEVSKYQCSCTLFLCIIWVQNIYNGGQCGRWVRNTHIRLFIGLDRETSSDSLLWSVKQQRQEGVFRRMIFDWRWRWACISRSVLSYVLFMYVQTWKYQCVMVTVWAFELLEVIVNLMLCRVTLALFLHLVSFRVFFFTFLSLLLV